MSRARSRRSCSRRRRRRRRSSPSSSRSSRARRVEGSAGGGMVRAEVSGALRVLAISIEPALLATGDREMLQDLTAAAVNAAIANAQRLVQEEMQKASSGLGLPLAAARSRPSADAPLRPDRPPRREPEAAARHRREVGDAARVPPARRDRRRACASSPTRSRGSSRTIVLCELCFDLTDRSPCEICRDEQPRRARSCAWSRSPPTCAAIERSGALPRPLPRARRRVRADRRRRARASCGSPSSRRACESGGIEEVVLATNPNAEGDATAHYLLDALRPTGVRLSRIAFGMPLGGDLEYADHVTVGHVASQNRRDARECSRQALKRSACRTPRRSSRGELPARGARGVACGAGKTRLIPSGYRGICGCATPSS